MVGSLSYWAWKALPGLVGSHYAFCRTWQLSATASLIASLTGPSGVRHNSFAAQPPDFCFVLRLPFGLWIGLHPCPPFSLVSGFCS